MTDYPEITTAPWDVMTVARLNAFQQRGGMHPFTCGNNTRDVLVATKDGWVCPNCEYKQEWALAFMVKIGMKITTAKEYSEALNEIEFPEPEPFIHLPGCISNQKYGLPRSFDGQEYCLICHPCNQAWHAALDAAREAVELSCGWHPKGRCVECTAAIAAIDALRRESDV